MGDEHLHAEWARYSATVEFQGALERQEGKLRRTDLSMEIQDGLRIFVEMAPGELWFRDPETGRRIAFSAGEDDVVARLTHEMALVVLRWRWVRARAAVR